MREVIARFNMEHLFDQQLPMLKQMFYQLDRLISIYLPDLHNHFRDESINSSYYSSSFFITIFSSHTQTMTDGQDVWKIQRVWDHFIVKGWKVVFKVCILILRIHEEELLAMSFEEMLRTLVKLPQHFLVDKPREMRLKVMKEEAKGKLHFLTSVEDEKAKQTTAFDQIKQDEMRLLD